MSRCSLDNDFHVLCYCSTKISVKCGSADQGYADTATYDPATCTFSAWLHSTSACPLCSAGMVQKQTTACNDGKKQVSYRIKDGVNCVISSSNSVYNQVTTESCSTTEVTQLGLIFGLTIPLIFALIVGVFALRKWLAYRTLYNEYSNLKSTVPTDQDEFGMASTDMQLASPTGHSTMDDMDDVDNPIPPRVKIDSPPVGARYEKTDSD